MQRRRAGADHAVSGARRRTARQGRKRARLYQGHAILRRMKRIVSALGVTLAVVVGASRAAAHHSFAMFDTTKQVTLAGTVTMFEWTNPHAYIELDVPG